ncbi:MAG: MurR/RpiR family transcriptional regulator, partial [Clostridia bacterium]|nr:MurR/RpiR family transcriptional regulator [Clostridia bacterium]
PIRMDDTDEVAIEKMFLASMRAMEDTLKAMNRQKLAETADKCVAASRIFVIGIESSAITAQELAMQLVSMGCDAMAVCNPMTMDALSTRYTEKDVFIGISRSGRSKVVIDSLKAARAGGSYTAFISNYINSPASALADAFFCTSCVDDVKNITGRESNLTMQTVTGALVLLMARKGVEARG